MRVWARWVSVPPSRTLDSSVRFAGQVCGESHKSKSARIAESRPSLPRLIWPNLLWYFPTSAEHCQYSPVRCLLKHTQLGRNLGPALECRAQASPNSGEFGQPWPELGQTWSILTNFGRIGARLGQHSWPDKWPTWGQIGAKLGPTWATSMLDNVGPSLVQVRPVSANARPALLMQGASLIRSL